MLADDIVLHDQILVRLVLEADLWAIPNATRRIPAARREHGGHFRVPRARLYFLQAERSVSSGVSRSRKRVRHTGSVCPRSRITSASSAPSCSTFVMSTGGGAISTSPSPSDLCFSEPFRLPPAALLMASDSSFFTFASSACCFFTPSGSEDRLSPFLPLDVVLGNATGASVGLVGADVDEFARAAAELLLVNEASAEVVDADELGTASFDAELLFPRVVLGDCDRATAGDALRVELPPADFRFPADGAGGSLSVSIAVCSSPFVAAAVADRDAVVLPPFFLSPLPPLTTRGLFPSPPSSRSLPFLFPLVISFPLPLSFAVDGRLFEVSFEGAAEAAGGDAEECIDVFLGSGGNGRAFGIV